MQASLNWTELEASLLRAGMSPEDTNVARDFSGAVYTLDSQCFSVPREFTFYPSRSPGSRTGGAYAEGKYVIFVEGLAADLSSFADSLRSSWPDATAWAVDRELCVFGLAVQLVRFRVQEDLGIRQFSSSGPKATKIPILARIIKSSASNPPSASLPPYGFDAYVVAAFATQMIAENKRDRTLPAPALLQLLIQAVRLDAKEVA